MQLIWRVSTRTSIELPLPLQYGFPALSLELWMMWQVFNLSAQAVDPK